MKGYRVAMPLSRISLYTPGGRVRGQVWLYIVIALKFWWYIQVQLYNFLSMEWISCIFGQSEAIRSEAMEHLRIREYLSKELANQTGKPVEQV